MKARRDRPQVSRFGEVAAWASRCEQIGFDGVWTTETNTDPYFPLVLAAAATERVELGTGIAVSFPRRPDPSRARSVGSSSALAAAASSSASAPR